MCVLLLLTVPAIAQEVPTPRPTAAAPAARRGRADTREFLGLGRAPDAAAAARGEKLYGPNCGFCHGAKATGAEGPDLVRSALVLHDEKGELIGPVIRNGRSEKGMPPFFAFDTAQLSDIAEFLHMRVELAVNRGLYKVQNVINGDAKAGKAYFDGPGTCSTCHSVTGDLAHIGTKFQPADLQQAFLYPNARGFEAGRASRSPKVTVTFRAGTSVTGTLKRLDDFTVSLYDSTGAYLSYAIDGGVKVDVEDKLAPHRNLLDKYTDTDMHNLTAYLASIQ